MKETGAVETPEKKKYLSRLYVRKEDRETNYDKLSPWQKKAFEKLWEGQTQADVARLLKKTPEWICKFRNSDLVKSVWQDRIDEELSDLYPLALRTARKIMTESPSETAKKDICWKVIERGDQKNRKEDTPLNVFNLTKNETILNMTPADIKGMKADLLKKLEESVGKSKS